MGADRNDGIVASILRGVEGSRRRRGPAVTTRSRGSRGGNGSGGRGMVCVSVLLMLGWAVVGSWAILELEAHPDSITNERTATFTYVCTQLDVTDETATCGVEVCATEGAAEALIILLVVEDSRTRL